MSDAQTVFVTGASGFIAKHIVLKLLNAGYHVVGSVRRLERGDAVRAAVLPHLADTTGLEARLRFVALDLTSDAGWDSALVGTDILMHTASPFPLTQPDDEDEVIRPAVDGTLRALRAAQAAGIRRVVMTSSSVAVMSTDRPAGREAHTEEDWTEISHPNTNAYAKSKTLAERAAWDFVASEVPQIALTTINPVVVTGPPLDADYGTSIRIVERLLRARDPLLPQFGIGIVDVRDVAEMHLRALTCAETSGKRFIAADRFLWYPEIADILKAAYPKRKIVTRRAPHFVVRILGLFDKAIRTVVPSLGQRHGFSNQRAREVMGMEFIDAAESIRATADFLIEHKIV